MAITTRAQVAEDEGEQVRHALRTLPDALLAKLYYDRQLVGELLGQVMAERSHRVAQSHELEQERAAAASFAVYVREWERLAKEATGAERVRLEDELVAYRARLSGAQDTVKTLEAELKG
jgi:hypothetical protein